MHDMQISETAVCMLIGLDRRMLESDVERQAVLSMFHHVLCNVSVWLFRFWLRLELLLTEGCRDGSNLCRW
jgi:hypothetical protein